MYFVRKTHGFRQLVKIVIMKKICIAILLLIAAKSKSQSLQFKAGDKAPNFTGITNDGSKIDLKKLVKNDPIAMVFYRGYWCPFCNKELNNLNDSLPILQAKGAIVIAITPEKYESVNKTIEETKASFDIISDTSKHIFCRFFHLTKKAMKALSSLFPKTFICTELHKFLPTVFYHIVFKYLYFDKDYRKRPSIKELL